RKPAVCGWWRPFGPLVWSGLCRRRWGRGVCAAADHRPNGWRVTAFATNTPPGGPGSQLPELALRHRRRARVEDRIRCMKDAGLRNLLLHGFDQNRIWLAVVALAADLLAGCRPSPCTTIPPAAGNPSACDCGSS